MTQIENVALYSVLRRFLLGQKIRKRYVSSVLAFLLFSEALLRVSLPNVTV